MIRSQPQNCSLCCWMYIFIPRRFCGPKSSPLKFGWLSQVAFCSGGRRVQSRKSVRTSGPTGHFISSKRSLWRSLWRIIPIGKKPFKTCQNHMFPNSHAMGSCKTNRRTGAVGSPSELVGGWCPGHVLMASGSCDAGVPVMF